MICYEVWTAEIDKMELYGTYTTEEGAVKVAKRCRELGYVGTISVYKVTKEVEKINY